MSKIRLFTNPLDAKSVIEYDIEAGTLLIDWLQQEYPDGFHGVLRVFIGPDELALEDLDYPVKDEEQITLLVMPSGGGVVASIAIQALVSIAIGYIINLIFGPQTPSGYDQEEQSPIYSLAPTPNQMRLGKPIEVQYGTCLATPAYAAAPYEFYDGTTNDMYADQLMCLGHGDFIISEIFVGDTPIHAMEAGSFQYWQIPLSQHFGSENNIEDIVNAALQPTDNPFPFTANMYTSPEVDGWEFNETLGHVYPTPAAFAGDAYAATTDPATGSFIKDRIENVDESLFLPVDENDPDNPQTGPFGAGLQVGDFIRLTGTLSNNVTFKIGGIVASFTTPGKYTIFQDHNETSVLTDEIPLAGGATYTLNETTEVSNMIAGPYRCQKEGQTVDRIYFDVEFPEGLYHVDKDDDRFTTNSVDFEFTVQEIDANGDPVGVPLVHNQRWSSKKRDPIRDTIVMTPATAGSFEVTVERTNPISDNNRDIEKAVWSGLRARVVPKPAGCYSDTTLLAVRMKATNGLGAAARQRLRVKMERVLTFGYLANPASAMKDIWINQTYGLGRPLAELNTTEINALEERWNTVDGPKLNGVFDSKSTGFAGMQQAVSIAAARVIQDGGLVTLVEDGIQNVRKALYSSANMVKDSFNLDFTFDTDSEYNSIEIEYRDPDTWQAKYVYSTDPIPSPLYADTYQLFGCTDEVYAGYYATYLANVKARRRKIVNFTTELEGLLPRFGDRIGISSDIPYWGESGIVIEDVGGNEIRVDKALNWTTNNVMILRDDMGGQLGEYSVTQGIAGPDHVQFAEAVTVYGPEGQEPTNYIFGEQTTLIRDFQVTKISPDTETTVTIEAQVYDPLIYEGGPPHQQPGTCKQYECDAYQTALLGLSPVAYYPLNIESELLNYENVKTARDYANGNDLIWQSGTAGQFPTSTPSPAGAINNCSGLVTSMTMIGDLRLLSGDPKPYEIPPPDGDITILMNYYSLGTSLAEIVWLDGSKTMGVSAYRIGSGTIEYSIDIYNSVIGGYQGWQKSFNYSAIDPDFLNKPYGVIARRTSGNTTNLDYIIGDQIVGTSTDIVGELVINGTPVFSQIGHVDEGSVGENLVFWTRALSNNELVTLYNAYKQNFSTYVDPDPNCSQPSCEDLSNAIKATSPDFYYPMNIQSEIDNYATDANPIKDHSGNANHLRKSGGSPVGIASTLSIATCSGVMTGADSAQLNLLRTSAGDTILGGMATTDSVSMFFQAGGYQIGDRTYGDIIWDGPGGYDNGVRGIYYTPSDAVRFTVSNTNQVNTGASGTIDYDFSAEGGFSGAIVGIVVYQDTTDTARLRYDIYHNFVKVTTGLVPLAGGQTQQSLTPDGPIVEISSCSDNAGSQEHAVWLRALTDQEIASMKTVWDAAPAP